MFALLDENRIVQKFSLQCQGKNPSQLRSMPLYYSLGGNITSLSGLFYPQSFCSPIIRGILRHLWGWVPSIALSLPDERGFPIWYAVKVIWIAVMFLYNMHCQAKTGKHFFPPKNSFQPCFSLQPPQIYYTYMSTRSFLLGSRTRLWFCRTEMNNFSAVTQNLKDTLVVENGGVLTEKNVDNWKPAWTFGLLPFHNRI